MTEEVQKIRCREKAKAREAQGVRRLTIDVGLKRVLVSPAIMFSAPFHHIRIAPWLIPLGFCYNKKIKRSNLPYECAPISKQKTRVNSMQRKCHYHATIMQQPSI
jgi:hypothetical protein